ncbi:MAG TPA: hypothetical protein VLA76_00350 [Candidatus Angelobacter sp.]|nr:hypothetical protein [Candidatus Angelobacter sp.]
MPEQHPQPGDATGAPQPTGDQGVDVMSRLANLTRPRPVFGQGPPSEPQLMAHSSPGVDESPAVPKTPERAAAANGTPAPEPTASADADRTTAPADTAPVHSPPRPRIGRLTSVPASELWAEPADLAAWIAADPSVLADAVGVPLAGAAVGPNPSRVSATDPAGTLVSVVCDVGDSTDASLAAVLEVAALGASSTVIWVAGEAASSHIASLSWLNRGTDARLFLVRVAGARIDGSGAAATMEVVVRPPRATDPDPETEPTPPSDHGRRVADHERGA